MDSMSLPSGRGQPWGPGSAAASLVGPEPSAPQSLRLGGRCRRAWRWRGPRGPGWEPEAVTYVSGSSPCAEAGAGESGSCACSYRAERCPRGGRRRCAVSAESPESVPRAGVLWVPDWPIVAAIAEGELPAHLPAAICDGRGLTVVSAPARRLGLRPGMTRRTAQSLVPELVLGPANPTQEVRAFEPVLQAAGEVVADIVLLRPGLAMVGVSGAARYHGGEEEVAAALVGAGAGAGVEAQVGVAAGFLTAILAARSSLIVPTSETAEFLFPHPVQELLHAATTSAARKEYSDLVSVWQRLGLTRLGDVARLEAADVAARFGRVGRYAHRLARGLNIQLSAAARSDADLAAGVDLDPPAQRLDIAAFAARDAARQLHSLLVGRGLACENLRVFARAENGAELSRSWRLDGPLSVEELTDRVRWQLGGWLEGRSGKPPSAPLVRIDLIAEGNYPAGAAQSGLWGKSSRNEEHATRAANRVQSRSEEHTSELQSRGHLVCRLLLEKKKSNIKHYIHYIAKIAEDKSSDKM